MIDVTQQDQVYDAEAVVPVGRTFESLEAIQAFLDGLRDEPWWPERVARVEVGRARGRSVGWFEPDMNAGRIELKSTDWQERVVVHELTHVIVMAEGGGSVHNPWWARRYTELVYRIMGGDVWAALTTSFKKHGVDYG